MKRNVLFAFVMVVSAMAFIACGKKAPTAWDNYELKGKVKELQIREYSAYKAFGEMNKDKLNSLIIVQFTPDGKFDHVSAEFYGRDRTREYECKYEHAGNTSTSNTFNDGELTSKALYEYQDWGGLELFTSYSPEGDEMWREEYWYDDDHRVIQEDTYYKGKLDERKLDYIYDDDDHLLFMNRYDKHGDLRDSHEYDYDEKGNRIEEVEKDPDGEVNHTTTYIYNEEGFPSTYKYDGRYWDTEIEYTYLYDKKGNYVWKTECRKDSKEGTIYDRTIIYY